MLSIRPNVTLSSHDLRRGRNVVMLSTQHIDGSVDDEEQDCKSHDILVRSGHRSGPHGQDGSLVFLKKKYKTIARESAGCAAINGFVIFMTKYPSLYGTKSHRKLGRFRDLR
ncbi:hypothetical protein T4B_1068 [Trichinella pseudospiralis]|uniref:PiggyBac transposable element-derived protein domain-containing protein n=1 Tax=Trichinella pseudospiralis TaxID=6337 RepID=A0A0V1JDV0_TRIPS|nr:hypothetical protein T4B_1068 [Trichinella pseudospiralis]